LFTHGSYATPHLHRYTRLVGHSFLDGFSSPLCHHSLVHTFSHSYILPLHSSLPHTPAHTFHFGLPHHRTFHTPQFTAGSHLDATRPTAVVRLVPHACRLLAGFCYIRFILRHTPLTFTFSLTTVYLWMVGLHRFPLPFTRLVHTFHTCTHGYCTRFHGLRRLNSGHAFYISPPYPTAFTTTDHANRLVATRFILNSCLDTGLVCLWTPLPVYTVYRSPHLFTVHTAWLHFCLCVTTFRPTRSVSLYIHSDVLYGLILPSCLYVDCLPPVPASSDHTSFLHIPRYRHLSTGYVWFTRATPALGSSPHVLPFLPAHCTFTTPAYTHTHGHTPFYLVLPLAIPPHCHTHTAPLPASPSCPFFHHTPRFGSCFPLTFTSSTHAHLRDFTPTIHHTVGYVTLHCPTVDISHTPLRYLLPAYHTWLRYCLTLVSGHTTVPHHASTHSPHLTYRHTTTHTVSPHTSTAFMWLLSPRFTTVYRCSTYFIFTHYWLPRFITPFPLIWDAIYLVSHRLDTHTPLHTLDRSSWLYNTAHRFHPILVGSPPHSSFTWTTATHYLFWFITHTHSYHTHNLPSQDHITPLRLASHPVRAHLTAHPPAFYIFWLLHCTFSLVSVAFWFTVWDHTCGSRQFHHSLGSLHHMDTRATRLHTLSLCGFHIHSSRLYTIILVLPH